VTFFLLGLDLSDVSYKNWNVAFSCQYKGVCTSGDSKDLAKTDAIAEKIAAEMLEKSDGPSSEQWSDNLLWIRNANAHHLVVGSQARILYCNAPGRTAVALAFNAAVADGTLSAPVVISRDHHDVR